MMKDELGKRVKRDYEDVFRLFLPRRSYTVVRIDGRAFHGFTKALERPYCRELADAFDQAARHLCGEMIGCRFAYGQSDEYSFLLTDFEQADAPLWFDGNLQKIVSVSASLFTAQFNRAFEHPAAGEHRVAVFDSRIMTIPRREGVENYFLWRQMDAEANSLNMLASTLYSHDELLQKSTSEKHDLLHGKGVNWAKCPTDFKRGRVIRTLEEVPGWHVDLDIPVFSRDRAYLSALIPGGGA